MFNSIRVQLHTSGLRLDRMAHRLSQEGALTPEMETLIANQRSANTKIAKYLRKVDNEFKSQMRALSKQLKQSSKRPDREPDLSYTVDDPLASWSDSMAALTARIEAYGVILKRLEAEREELQRHIVERDEVIDSLRSEGAQLLLDSVAEARDDCGVRAAVDTFLL